MRAVCSRCGSEKTAFDGVCVECGHRPEGEGMLVAWLLSEHHLPRGSLEAAGARIQKGDPPRPSNAQLSIARRHLGQSVVGDPGLSLNEALLLLAGNIAFSPLIGWVSAISWWKTRPRAAVQSAVLALPVSVLGTGLFVYAMGWI